jgi:hypothetical protein
MLPHSRTTVELNLSPKTSYESSSNSMRSLLYMASSSSVAGSSSCSSAKSHSDSVIMRSIPHSGCSTLQLVADVRATQRMPCMAATSMQSKHS